MILPQFYVDDLIKNAIKEDISYIDVATDYLLDENHTSEAVFIAKADGVLCGIDVAMRVFQLLDDSFTCTLHKKDGDQIKKGDLIAEVGNGLSLPQHASIDGKITLIDNDKIIIEKVN